MKTKTVTLVVDMGLKTPIRELKILKKHEFIARYGTYNKCNTGIEINTKTRS